MAIIAAHLTVGPSHSDDDSSVAIGILISLSPHLPVHNKPCGFCGR